jgi:hypothetical protein
MSLKRRISLEASAYGDYTNYASMPATFPIQAILVGKFNAVPEAFSLDGRLW